MKLSNLQPANTQKAKATASNVFKRFLDDENVSMENVTAAVCADPSGSILVSLLDRFGVFLAFQESKRGEKLAHNTVMQYCRQAKLWLLERFPQSSAHVESALLKKGSLLDKYCKTRPDAVIVKQANACTKDDLYLLMKHMYSTASCPTDYQDIALLSLLWFLFGRASDLTLLGKQNLSLCGGVFFVRFVRMKTSQENGLSLFPDTRIATCPITALAAALAMQSTPSTSLLPHLPAPTAADIKEFGPLIPLADVLSGATVDVDLLDDGRSEAGEKAKARKTTPGIHSYVNRVLAKNAEPAGVTTSLTSHSFWRGGAQAANGCPDLTLQWIADRGGWNLSSTNKAFEYIFNTTQEDLKVTKVLSGWETKAPVPVVSSAGFDSLTRTKLDVVKAGLFACCSGLQSANLNLDATVTDVLCSHLIKAFPEIKAMQPGEPLVRRIEDVLTVTGIAYEEILAWSVHLGKEVSSSAAVEKKLDPQEVSLMKAQASVIEELLQLTTKLASRVEEVELQLQGKTAINKRKAEEVQQESVSVPTTAPPKRRKTSSTNLVETWYEWYACRAHLNEALPKREKSDMRSVVGFMNLFAGDFALDEAAPDFRDRVLALGHEVELRVLAFMRECGSKARSIGTVLKTFREQHRLGKLNTRIADYALRRQAGLIIDPTPACSRATIAAISPRKLRAEDREAAAHQS